MFKNSFSRSEVIGSVGIMGAFAAANQAFDLYKNLNQRYEEKFCYTGKLKGESYIYHYFLEWLEKETSSKGVEWRSSSAKGIQRQFSSTNGQNVYFDGYKVKVTIEKDDSATSKIFGESDTSKQSAHFTSNTREGIEAVERILTELHRQVSVSERRTWLYTPEKYGWSDSKLPRRSIDSVFLAPGEKNSMMEDLEAFFSSEDHYDRIGAPWHRGYLLYGEPGNGKSSIASAIANKYKLNLYSLPLSAVENDTALVSLINDMEERSVLLIEDIDVFKHSTTRDNKGGGPTLAGLLNALDGVGTPHGMLTFITTNHVDNLDPALIRAGRTDYRLELKAPVDEQIEDLFFYAYSEPLGVKPKTFKNMAEVANILKTNVTDADKARRELSE